MAEHTKLPWRVDHRANTRVVAGEDETVAATGCQSSIRDDWEANAAFIVLAVNNHERLVEALKLQEKADKFHMECEECDGEEAPELCEECFPLYDDARVARRAILTDLIGASKP